MLGGGLPANAINLIAGMPGTGKTILAQQYLFANSGGRRGLYLSTASEPSAVAAAFGWPLSDRRLKLMYRSPVDLYLDEWVYELLALVESHEAQRIVIDGVNSLRLATHDQIRFRECLYSLVKRCSRQGARLMMTLESAELFGIARLPAVSLSQIADNVVLLQFVRREREYRRALVVLKSRGTGVEPRLNEYVIGPDGIELVTP